MLQRYVPKFYAVTSKGLIDSVENELKGLGLSTLERTPSGVGFESNWEGCYKANLHLRSATRVLKPVLDFPAYQLEDLYHNVLKHDFTKYIKPNQSLSVESAVRNSKISDQRMVALKTKDAIVDQFRDKFGERPNVDTKTPDVKVFIRIVKNQVSVAIDTTGNSLFMRGYRQEAGDAPLREHLAAALLEMTGWTPDIPLYDPMCGSGTFLIEAALKAQKVAPGTLRKNFSFQNFNTYNDEMWSDLVNTAIEFEDEPEKLQLFGSDLSGKVLKSATANATRAGVEEFIEFQKMAITEIRPPCEDKGIVIVNPPYGERMGDNFQLGDLYKDLAYAMKSHFKGWTLWLLSGNDEVTRHLKLKATRRIPVYNGNIQCRFLEYPIT